MTQYLFAILAHWLELNLEHLVAIIQTNQFGINEPPRQLSINLLSDRK